MFTFNYDIYTVMHIPQSANASDEVDTNDFSWNFVISLGLNFKNTDIHECTSNQFPMP